VQGGGGGGQADAVVVGWWCGGHVGFVMCLVGRKILGFCGQGVCCNSVVVTCIP
jgi:hypothetical protein